jgi:hypothetical protein
MTMTHHQNSGQNHNILIPNKSCENEAKSKYLQTVTNKNCIHEEIKHRLNLVNACYHSVQNLLSSFLLTKNLEIKIHKSTALPHFVWV